MAGKDVNKGPGYKEQAVEEELKQEEAKHGFSVKDTLQGGGGSAKFQDKPPQIPSERKYFDPFAN